MIGHTNKQTNRDYNFIFIDRYLTRRGGGLSINKPQSSLLESTHKKTIIYYTDFLPCIYGILKNIFVLLTEKIMNKH